MSAAPSSPTTTPVTLNLSQVGFHQLIQNALTTAYGQAKAQTLIGQQQMQAFITQVTPIIAGLVNEQATGTGKPEVSLAKLGDASESLGAQLVADADFKLHEIFAAAMQTVATTLGTLVQGYLTATPWGAAAVIAAGAAASVLSGT